MTSMRRLRKAKAGKASNASKPSATSGGPGPLDKPSLATRRPKRDGQPSRTPHGEGRTLGDVLAILPYADMVIRAPKVKKLPGDTGPKLRLPRI